MGRPKGSKNKPKVNVATSEVKVDTPKENKTQVNKETPKENKITQKITAPVSELKPGRPKGTKNKPKVSKLESTVNTSAHQISTVTPVIKPKKKTYNSDKIPDFIKKCEKCHYSATDNNTPWKYVCLYILHEGHSRGCDPENCDKFKKATSKKKTGKDMNFLFSNLDDIGNAGDIYDRKGN